MPDQQWECGSAALVAQRRVVPTPRLLCRDCFFAEVTSHRKRLAALVGGYRIG